MSSNNSSSVVRISGTESDSKTHANAETKAVQVPVQFVKPLEFVANRGQKSGAAASGSEELCVQLNTGVEILERIQALQHYVVPQGNHEMDKGPVHSQLFVGYSRFSFFVKKPIEDV